MQPKSALRLRIALVVVAVFAALVSIATFGVDLPLSPFEPIRLNAPSVADSNGKRTAIVDSESRRILILNQDYKITGIVNCDALNAPVDAVTNVCVTDKTIYVAGVQYQKDSDLIVRERVVAYGPRGSSEAIVYDESVDNELIPSIKTMDCKDEDVFVVMASDSETQDDSAPSSKVRVVKLNRNTKEEIDTGKFIISDVFDLGYSFEANEFQTVSMRGVLDDDYGYASKKAAEAEANDAKQKSDAAPNKTTQKETEAETPFLGDHMFISLDLSNSGDAYLYDDATSSLCLLDDSNKLQTLFTEKGYDRVHVNGNYITLCNQASGFVAIARLDNSDFQKLDSVFIAPSLSALVGVVTACHVYLAIFAAVVIYRKVRALIASGRTQGIGPMFASFAVVLVLSIAIGYISYGSYQTMMQTREKEIDTFADYLGVTAETLSESMEKCRDRSAYRKNNDTFYEAYSSMFSIEMMAGSLASVATSNGLGTYVNVYGKDDKGVFYVNDSSREHVMGSTVLTANKDEIEKIFDTNETSLKAQVGSNLRDATLYRLVRIPTVDDKGTAGVIEVGSRLRTFEASVRGNLVQRILAALVMALVVYLTYAELRACAGCFVSYRELEHHHDAIAVLTRPFSFFVTLLSSIDAVMTTLIARALIGSTGMSGSSVLLALPAVMLGVGLAVGQAIYGFFGSRVLIQRLMRRGAIAVVLAAIFTGAAVWVGNFWLYCFAKLLMAIPFGLLYTLSYSLPRRADSDEVRALAAGGIKRTDTSAAALGTVLGGWVAQVLGNAWVYALVAIVGVILFVLAKRVLPRTKHPLEHEAKTVESRREAIVKLLTSKTTLPIIFFVMLPAILAAGYNSFLFPLFSANLGIETSAINNLFVLGQLVVFVCISGLERLEERYDKWRVAYFAVALLAVVFLLFSFNTTLAWAVLTIALVGVLCKATDGWKAMWPRSAKANGLTTGMATGSMFAVRSVLLIVQPLILGALLAAGNKTTVIVLGIICAVCAVLFYLTTRHSALAPNNQISLEEELLSDDTPLPLP